MDMMKMYEEQMKMMERMTKGIEELVSLQKMQMGLSNSPQANVMQTEEELLQQEFKNILISGINSITTNNEDEELAKQSLIEMINDLDLNAECDCEEGCLEDFLAGLFGNEDEVDEDDEEDPMVQELQEILEQVIDVANARCYGKVEELDLVYDQVLPEIEDIIYFKMTILGIPAYEAYAEAISIVDGLNLIVLENNRYNKHVGDIVTVDSIRIVEDESKRTIVALLYNEDGKVVHRATAKCHENDTYISAVGGAIALRRLLDLKVPSVYIQKG